MNALILVLCITQEIYLETHAFLTSNVRFWCLYNSFFHCLQQQSVAQFVFFFSRFIFKEVLCKLSFKQKKTHRFSTLGCFPKDSLFFLYFYTDNCSWEHQRTGPYVEITLLTSKELWRAHTFCIPRVNKESIILVNVFFIVRCTWILASHSCIENYWLCVAGNNSSSHWMIRRYSFWNKKRRCPLFATLSFAFCRFPSTVRFYESKIISCFS